MNKLCSLLIILLIIYLTYDYCSNTVEGNDAVADEIAARNKQTETDDAAKIIHCSKSPVTSITDGVNANASESCQYKNVSCINNMQSIGDDKWKSSYTDYDGVVNYKTQCQLCVKGSKLDGTTRSALSNVIIGESHFAYDLCDAMAAGCDSGIFYANNKQGNWSHDCKLMESTPWTSSDEEESNALNKALCSVLQNDIIQFFLGFMGGIECTLLIKEKELKGWMGDKIDDIKDKLTPPNPFS